MLLLLASNTMWVCSTKSAGDSFSSKRSFPLSNSLSQVRCCWLLFFDLFVVDNFSLGGTRLTGTIPIEFWESVTEMHIFTITATDLTGTLPTELGLWTTTEHLNIAHTEISGTIPTEIGLMKHLTRFQASTSGLSGTFPTELGLLTGLGKSSLLFVCPLLLRNHLDCHFHTVVSHSLGPVMCSACLTHTHRIILC
jgi:hypothetical protein